MSPNSGGATELYVTLIRGEIVGRKSRMKKERRSDSAYTDLTAHKRIGKSLVPPLAQVPNVTMRSWLNDRLPEYLWASLLLTSGPREAVIELFRSFGPRVRALGENAITDVSLSGIARNLPTSKEVFIDFICGFEPAKIALAPLILFPGLPGLDAWKAAIGLEAPADAWDRIGRAVLETVDHQSQMSTDLRWLALLPTVAAGRVHVPAEYAHIIKEIELYPHLGDQRAVRPTIRAMEIGFAGAEVHDYPRTWANEFWRYCRASTGCTPLNLRYSSPEPAAGTTKQKVTQSWTALIDHCIATSSTTSVDPRHDATFGIALYAMQLTKEVMAVGNSTSLSGRFSVRVVLDLFVTLAYLARKNNDELWKTYRVYGSGQAKLSSLKLESSSDKPTGVSGQMLESLANEDVWQEFLSIDLGHWDNSNTRKLSEEAGVKDYYDKYYPWSSMYLHGHWGALRATVFDTCANPLHRLHRIPRSEVPAQPDVLQDIVRLVDRILSLVDRLYPGFTYRLSNG